MSPSDTAKINKQANVSRAPIPRLKSLTAKQAGATLLIVLFLGLLGAGFQLYDSWYDTRTDVRARIDRTRDLIEAAAVEAAYKLSPRLARNVVTNLTETDGIVGARLRTNFDEVLATAGRDPDAPPPDASRLALYLFGDITRYNIALSQAEGRGDGDIGRLDIRLSARHLAADFYSDAIRNTAIGALRALGICALVVGVFYAIITRPLVRISNEIARVDATRPLAFQLDRPRGHRHDELGQVVNALNDLLTAFQEGLDRRDSAERDLTELNRDLEQRVADRTRAIEHVNEELEREKAETERAFRELERTHGELREANQQIIDSLNYAQRIQTAALPHRGALDRDVADLHLWWEPLQEVGGDYVWMEHIDGKALILIADCTGHGVPGAFMTLITAAALDRLVHDRGLREPADILVALDTMVRRRLRQDCSDTNSDDGLEAAACLLDPATGTLTFAGAGLPLIYGQQGEIHELRGDRAFLGYRTLPRTDSLRQHSLTLEPGGCIYLLTDGVTDQMGEQSRRLFGRARLRRELASVQDMSMAEQVDHIRRTLADYRGTEGKRDDITMLAMRPLSASDGG